MNEFWGESPRLMAMCRRQVRREHAAWVRNRNNRLYRLEQKRFFHSVGIRIAAISNYSEGGRA